VGVTFDSLCGCAFMYRNTDNPTITELVKSNFLDMIAECIRG
jgi:hypothetical protein